MKTETTNQRLNLKEGIFVMSAFMMLLSSVTSGQPDSTQTLFKSNVNICEVLTPEVKFNSIQGDLGTLIGFYGGALINRTILAVLAGGVNLGHPRVNYGYIGGIAQVIFKPEKLVHSSGQIVVAYGSTKDYENEKTSVFDNFWNISGAGFFMLEPGANIELNLDQRHTLVVGMSYRYVSGLNENDESVSRTHVTNKELSGINFNVGLKFSKEKQRKL